MPESDEQQGALESPQVTAVEHYGLPARIPRQMMPRLYRWIAPVYDLAGYLLASKARQKCIKTAQIRNPEAVLEVGVGTGLTFAEILRLNPKGRNEGVDITAAMVNRAQRRAQRVKGATFQVLQGDAYDLDVKDESFDCVVSTYVVDLLPGEDILDVLTEWKRVLRPGGRLVLVYKTNGKRWYQKIWDACYRYVPFLLGGSRGVSLEDPVTQVGMERVQVDTVSQLTLRSAVLLAFKPEKKD